MLYFCFMFSFFSRLTFIFFLFSSLFFSPTISISSDQTDTKPHREEYGNFLSEKLTPLISKLPGRDSEGFRPLPNCPDGDSKIKKHFQNLLTGLFQGTLKNPKLHAEILGFDLIQYTDRQTNLSFYFLVEKLSSDKGLGIYAINPNAKRRLVIEAPHPKNDMNSAEVAAKIFLETNAIALFISGTHRCANQEASTCSGQTSVCSQNGTKEPYRISDVAHHTCNLFHAAHEAFSDLDLSTHTLLPLKPVFLQIHGFTQDAGESDIVLSDGVHRVADSSELIAKLATKIKTKSDAKADSDGITICQGDPTTNGLPTPPDTSLCATTNVQGRYTNASTDCCTQKAIQSYGRFIHIELSRDMRDITQTSSTELSFQDLLEAIQNTFSLRTPLKNQNTYNK